MLPLTTNTLFRKDIFAVLQVENAKSIPSALCAAPVRMFWMLQGYDDT